MPCGAYRMLAGSMARAAIVAGLGLVTIGFGLVRHRAAGVLALIVMTADLATVDAPFVVTVPQAAFESPPEAIRIIADAGARESAPGPFRIDRMPAWHPSPGRRLPRPTAPPRSCDGKHNTLQAKYGVATGIEYTHTFGVAQLHDYDWFFDGHPWPSQPGDGRSARRPGRDARSSTSPADPSTCGTRGTRHPLLSARMARSFARICFVPAPGPNRSTRPARRRPGLCGVPAMEDWRIRRNADEFPRLGRPCRTAGSSRPPDRRCRSESTMREMIYADDPFWRDGSIRVLDPHAVASVEPSTWNRNWQPYLSGRPPQPARRSRCLTRLPQRAELEVMLESPGLVILADLHYPGWELTIDGQPAPIYRVNRLMRGAAVPAGKHHLVYSYVPRSSRSVGSSRSSG